MSCWWARRAGKSFLAQALGYAASGRGTPSAQPRRRLLQVARTRMGKSTLMHHIVAHKLRENRAVDEWLGLFDDPILGNSALDRLANASYQIVIEGAATGNGSPHIGPC